MSMTSACVKRLHFSHSLGDFPSVKSQHLFGGCQHFFKAGKNPEVVLLSKYLWTDLISPPKSPKGNSTAEQYLSESSLSKTSANC